MYEIRPESIKTFITANDIKLPRFQRKQTWDAKKNFELCISVFKNYPIGVSILSVDSNRARPVRWLLDGRQRRNALKMLFDDPENAYFWAQKYVKFKNNAQPNDVIQQCREKIAEFLEAEDDDEEDTPTPDVDTDVEPDIFPPVDDDEERDEEESTVDLQEGINILYEIIRLCHNKNRHGTGFSAPFDIQRFVPTNYNLPYVRTREDGTYYLSSKLLKNFISNYLKFCDDERLLYQEKESFKKFLVNQNIPNNPRLDNHIRIQWSFIVERIDILLRIDYLLSTQTIGLIEVKNLSPADSQKIFNLINTKGSPLKAVEILSARPKWNVPIQSPTGEVRQLVDRLYREQMDIVPEGVVRWDLAATFIKRLGNNIVFKSFSNATTDFEKEITTSFKCMSGVFVSGITKIDIDKLVDCNINWETDIDTLVNDFKNMFRTIEGFSYFSFLKQWNVSIQEITSDGIAYNFAILCYKYYIEHNRPMGSTSEVKKFQKYCFILWDKLIYEYLNLEWKGSSDSKIHNNIVSYTSNETALSQDKWLRLLEEVLTTNMINEKEISYTYLQPLLYHIYCLLGLTAPASAQGFDIDHIIPQTAFSESQLPNKKILQDNLFNLALLPKKENISKSNKRLVEITDSWLKHQIGEYEFIPDDKYQLFSDVTKYKDLFEYRKPKFEEALKDRRTFILNN